MPFPGPIPLVSPGPPPPMCSATGLPAWHGPWPFGSIPPHRYCALLHEAKTPWGKVKHAMSSFPLVTIAGEASSAGTHVLETREWWWRNSRNEQGMAKPGGLGTWGWPQAPRNISGYLHTGHTSAWSGVAFAEETNCHRNSILEGGVQISSEILKSVSTEK